MQCPRCKTTLPLAAMTCPQCEFDLSLQRSLQNLKTDLVKTRMLISEQLDLLEKRVDLFDSQIMKTLISTPVTQDMPIRTSAPTKTAESPKTFSQEIGNESTKDLPAFKANGVQEVIPEPPPLPESYQQIYQSPETPSVSQKRPGFEARLGEKWLLIVGIGIMVLGVGFFLKYSFDQNWIGPAGRVTLSFLLGVIALCAGEFFRRKSFETFGLYIIGGGIATLYFSTIAAREIYELMGPITTFSFMVLITALAGTLSLFYNSKWLSVLGLVGGFITPLVLSTGKDSQVALMSYMVLLNSAILAIAAFRQWSLLNYLGCFFTWVLFIGWFDHFYDQQIPGKFWLTMFFLQVFFLIYAVVPFLYYFVRERPQQVRGFALTMPNAFLAFGFSFYMIEHKTNSVMAVSIVSISYAAIFLLMASYLYRRNRENLSPFVLLLAKAMLFLIVTVPVLFSAHWITVFWAAQALVMMWAALRLQSKRLYWAASLLLLITIGKFFLYDYDAIFKVDWVRLAIREGYITHLFERWLTSAMVLGTIYQMTRMLRAFSTHSHSWPASFVIRFWVGAFAILLFSILNLEVSAFFYDHLQAARFAAISVLWAFFAIVLMIIGFSKEQAIFRRCSMALFLITAIKVLFFDMSHVSTHYRIFSFMGVGLLLIGASYLYHRFRSIHQKSF